MAKAIVASADENSMVGRVKSWPQSIKSFYSDVRTEMKKVTTPSRKEVQATTAVVIVTVFIFALYFWVVDGVVGKILENAFRFFERR